MSLNISPYRYACGGLVAMASAMGIGRFIFTPVLPAMMEALHLSAGDAGLIASANYLGYLVGAFAAMGSWGKGREYLIITTALTANIGLLAAMALTNDMTLFLMIRFAAGFVSALAMIFTTTLVAFHLNERGRGDLQWLHFSGVATGIMASAIASGFVYFFFLPWAATWYMAAFLCAVMLIAFYVLIPARLVSSVKNESEPPLLWRKSLILLIIAYAIFGCGYIVTATFLVAIVRDGNLGPFFEALVWLTAGVAGFPSVWFWGRVAKRFGLTGAFAIGCLVEMVGVVASVAVPGNAGPLIGALLLGGTFIGITALGLQAARLLAGQSPRTAMAAMTAAFGTGQIIGPILAGYGAQISGSFFWPSIGAALALALAGLIGLGSAWRLVQR